MRIILNIIIFIFVNCLSVSLFAQRGFVATMRSDDSGSAGSVGQLFSHTSSSSGYLCEGNQNPFLYRDAETIHTTTENLPVIYRPADRNPMRVAYALFAGDHQVYLLPVIGVDTLIRVSVLVPDSLCPNGFTVSDIDGNTYHTVNIASLCWTKENMKSFHYTHNEFLIPGVMVYHADMYPDQNANYNKYGCLYTWYSAVNVPENDLTPFPDNHSPVQGVCPSGWHIPSLEELQSLSAFPARDLKTTYDWLINDGTNLTGFSALPAGMFDGIRFINLKGNTAFWSTDFLGESATSTQLNYYCDELNIEQYNKNYGFSIRCVKNQ